MPDIFNAFSTLEFVNQHSVVLPPYNGLIG